MGELVCKVCGYEGQAGQTECPECGAPLYPVERAPGPEAAVPGEVYITSKVPAKKQPSPRGRRLRWAACFLALCLIFQGCGLWLQGQRKGMFPAMGESWYYQYNSNLITPEGYFPLPMASYVQGSGVGGRAVIVDQRAIIYGGRYSDLADATTVYYYDGHTIQETDWSSAYLNADATVLFFVRREGEECVLSRRDLERDRTQELLRDKGWISISSMASDGSAVMCYTGVDGGLEERWLWSQRAGATPLETPEDGAREYTLKLGREGRNRLTYRFAETDEEVSVRVDWGRLGIQREFAEENMSVLTDRDLTEIIYRDADGIWRYENETGKTREIAGLEGVETLWALTPYTRGAMLGQSKLTPWVYQGEDNHLYRIGSDLQAEDLTPEGEARRFYIHPEGKELYYTTWQGELVRILRPLERNWEALPPVTLATGGDVEAATDLSVLAGKVSSGGQMGWRIFTEDGEDILLEHAAQNGWAQCLSGGGCWYEGKGHELWFWSRETGEQKVMGPGNSATVAAVGDGAQAILCQINYPDGKTQEDYWLLDNKGNATKLEVREDGIAGVEEQDGSRYGIGGVLSSRYIPIARDD